MDIDALRAFVETARRGSFSAAAAALGVGQPTVSRRVANLEAGLGVRLLQRSRPAVTPTRAGLLLAAFANRMLTEWDALRPALSEPSAAAGPLQVVASTSPGERLVPGLLAAFTRRHPAVRAQMHVMNSDTVENCVRARHCDVGFIGRAARAARLAAVPIADDEILLAVPAGHRLAGRLEADLAELSGESLVVREAGSATRSAVLSALRARGEELPPHRVALEVDSAHAARAAVAAGLGLAFLSALVADGARGELATLRLRELRIVRPIVMLFDRRRLSPQAAAFVAYVGQHAAAARLGTGRGRPS